MEKTGIAKIGFINQIEYDDQWNENRAAWNPDDEDVQNNPNLHYFTSIDQEKSTMTQTSATDENGVLYSLRLSFVVRKEEDIELARKYANVPLVILVRTADGKNHHIGNSVYPAHFELDQSYNGVATKELALQSQYESETEIMG